jgi:hypothetical protein
VGNASTEKMGMCEMVVVGRLQLQNCCEAVMMYSFGGSVYVVVAVPWMLNDTFLMLMLQQLLLMSILEMS